MRDDSVLIADIGGTYARLALVRADHAAGHVAENIARFEVSAFESVEELLRHYLGQQLGSPARAVLAVAGPVNGEEVRITNNPWRINVGRLAAELRFDSVRVANDFAAMSASIPGLPRASLEPIGGLSAPLLDGRRPQVLAVVGPGTGLGVGVLLAGEGQLLIIDTEGGHTGFAPCTKEEREILALLSRRYGRVSNERILSSGGLLNLYEAACEMADVPAPARTPEDVTAAAAGGDEHARRAVEIFCELLGSLSGDVAMMTGAWEGVYVAGGLVAPLLPWLRNGRFRERFESKGRLSAALAATPTIAITHEYPGLLGAGALAFSSSVRLVRQCGT